ncbi:MAG TPA: HEAT repeat domain-containing protein [Acidimicrobiales bacterium]|nr:HEAT repeat domain-containing protein [Acidimicrobiales bacterium]
MLLAASHPDVFVSALRRRRVMWWSPRTTVAVILREIADPKTADLVCGYLRDRNWLARLHAVRALDRMGGEDAHRCIEKALRDREPYVRMVAIQAISRWDRGRAKALYKQALHPARGKALPPHVKREAEADLEDLEAGRVIPVTRPWRVGPF